MWSKESRELRASYEDQCVMLQRGYQVEYERICNATDVFMAARDDLIKKSSLEMSCSQKKVAPYRIFKREMAFETK